MDDADDVATVCCAACAAGLDGWVMSGTGILLAG